MTETIARLADIPSDYVHTEKSIVPADDLALPGAHLKWYDIYLAGRETPDEIREQARKFLSTEVEAGRLEFRDELGYAMLHLDGEGYFLLVVAWRNTNEMWQTLYGRDDNGFHPYPPKEGALKPTQNIFELDCTAHERRAWSRFLSSPRDEAAKQAYIDDKCTGILV
ncbi:hypothetical protein [Streptomyces sp. HUAS TT7]|uniref:hypothetical protein n=1 Tax=Streptomyces sp. HUAS TT7 TaxID=3447507 RepID=UPI003F659465